MFDDVTLTLTDVFFEDTGGETYQKCLQCL